MPMPTLKRKNPAHRQLFRATVTRAERVTPHFVCITVQSAAIADLDYLGFDQEVKLFFPRRDQEDLRLPNSTGSGWIPRFFLTPQATRPHLRNYTIRACRPGVGELDIEFVVHGDGSPASYWATRAVVGDEVGIFPEGMQYLPPPDVNAHLLVADESAVPAVLSILEQLPDGPHVTAYLEVPADEDVRATPDRARTEVNWLPRNASTATPGALALDTVRRASLPEGDIYSFIAGESRLATGVRRHLVNERGHSKSAVTFVGYWKEGRSTVD